MIYGIDQAFTRTDLERMVYKVDLRTFNDEESMSRAVAEDIAEVLRRKPESLLSLAAGNTSLGVFKELIALYESGEIDFSCSRFVAMDEWKDMSISTPESCSDFLYTNFISKVNILSENVRYLNGQAEDLNAECALLNEYIYAEGGLDYLLLGVGMNGHLALNEPGVDFSLSVHVTSLDTVTQEVGKKYFTKIPKLTGGLTIGIADIRKARRVMLCVSGAKKRDILKRLMSEPISNRLPATVLREMPQAVVVCDREAASLL